MASQRSESLLTSIAKKCPKPKDENGMKLYTLPLEKSSAIANRYSLGQPNPYECKTSKTILVMGATGSGKTTWINAMINYVLGVEWDDPFRYKLVDEEVNKNQAHSQTQGVTVYDIHHQNGFRIPFSLTIVDTPGFGDTKGIERDKEITSDIANFFKDKNGIEKLDAVGFVVPSSTPRLTSSQKYVFNSVLSIFGADVKENVRFLITSADGKRPPVLEAIIEAKLPCRMDLKGLPCHQKFNNGSIYVNNQDDEDDEMSPIEWKNGMKNFNSFFKELSEMPTKSLQMTREVLENRKQMELKLQWMQGAIPKHLSEMEELRKKEAIIELNQAEIDANKNYEKKVKVAKNVKESYHRTTLCCTICETICQADCDPSVGIMHSEAFNVVPTVAAIIPISGWIAVGTQYVVNKVTDPKCKICKCVCSNHEKGQFRWIYKNVEETTTLQDMKKTYEAAKGKKMNAKQLVEELKKDVEDQKKKIVKQIDEIKDLHNSLKKNALRGNPLTTAEYIQMLIENEKNERQEGYEERISNLKELLKLAKMADDIVEDAAGFLKQQLRI